jgi:Fe-S cluster assembly protein SufD
MKSAHLSMDALDGAIARLPDSSLAPLRSAALAHLREHGLPTTRDEDWKYTDLTPLVNISNQWLDRGDDVTQQADTSGITSRIQQSINADWLIIANGQVDAHSIAALTQAGVNVELLSEHDNSTDFSAPLANLNTALLSDGLRISVDADCIVKKPIGILVVDSATTTASISQIRADVVVGANSTLDLIEYHASSGEGDHYANSVVNLRLENNAHANCVRIQDRARTHNQTGRTTVSLGRNSQFQHCAFDFGGRLIRNDLVVEITEPGSSAVFDGLYLAGDEQHIDNHTRVDHRVGPATSQQEYRGVLTGNARCIWNGKAIVHEGADGTDAEQANHNLLLSDKAEIDAKPELEIYTDDVKCSHGTTVGQLEEKSLFYLRTRGIDEISARQILTLAFAQSIVSKVPIQALHEALTETVTARLAGLIEANAE